MEYRNTSHPDYDPELELLTRIPSPPRVAYYATLAKQMGLADQTLIARWVARLQKRFLGLYTGTKHSGTEEGRAIWASRADWPQLELCADEYYDKVYPASEPPVARPRLDATQ